MLFGIAIAPNDTVLGVVSCLIGSPITFRLFLEFLTPLFGVHPEHTILGVVPRIFERPLGFGFLTLLFSPGFTTNSVAGDN